MKIAISTLVYSKGSLEEACARLSDWGYRYIDLAVQQDWCHVQPARLEVAFETELEQLEQLFSKYSLTPIALNASLESSDQQLMKVVQLAEKLDVQRITIPSSPLTVPVSEEITRLQRLQQLTAESNVEITIETHTGQWTETPQQALQLMEQVPGIGLTLDISHYYCNETEEEIEQLIPYVKHVHVRDCGRTWEQIQMPFGTGLLDLPSLFNLLEKYNYTGDLSIEYIDLDEVQFDLRESIDPCYKTIKQLRGERS